jgi:hypothetical protein
MMAIDPTIHVMPRDGLWLVMTDDSSFVKDGLETRGEAIRCASQVAAAGRFTFLMIHSKDDMKDVSERSH